MILHAIPSDALLISLRLATRQNVHLQIQRMKHGTNYLHLGFQFPEGRDFTTCQVWLPKNRQRDILITILSRCSLSSSNAAFK